MLQALVIDEYCNKLCAQSRIQISSTRPLLLDPPSKLMKDRPRSPFKSLFHFDWSKGVTPIHDKANVSLARASNLNGNWPHFMNYKISVAYWTTSHHFELRARRIVYAIG